MNRRTFLRGAGATALALSPHRAKGSIDLTTKTLTRYTSHS